MMTSSLSLRDMGLALAIMFVWGTNFVVIHVGLAVLPPLLFATLRFTFVLLPAVFFLKKPDLPWRYLVLYGVGTGLIQFGLLFIAMRGMISPGLASLVVQMQAFFTVAIAMQRQGERVAPYQLAAFGLALAGMGVIAGHNGHGATVLGLALTLGSALGWSISNQTAREASHFAAAQGRPLNLLALIVWSSLFSVPPLLVLSLLLEGPHAIVHALASAGPVTWSAVLWQSVGNTLFGYTCWAWLLSRYPAATVSPLSLLVPVFGFAASAALLGEPLPVWKLAATALIMAGLVINVFWGRRKPKLMTVS
jgi:O-acetylserine/cysteine efflux transporter